MAIWSRSWIRQHHYVSKMFQATLFLVHYVLPVMPKDIAYALLRPKILKIVSFYFCVYSEACCAKEFYFLLQVCIVKQSMKEWYLYLPIFRFWKYRNVIRPLEQLWVPKCLAVQNKITGDSGFVKEENCKCWLKWNLIVKFRNLYMTIVTMVIFICLIP